MNIAEKLIDTYNFEKQSETFHKNPVYSKTFQNKESGALILAWFMNKHGSHRKTLMKQGNPAP